MVKLLIVEDEPVTRNFLSKTIKWEKINVVCEAVSEASAALEKLMTEQVDIVITDMKMPGMSGIELMEKAAEHGIKSKFFVLSGYNDFEYVSRAYKLGAVDYFLKVDITSDILLNAVSNCIDDISADETEKAMFHADPEYMAQWSADKRRVKRILEGKDPLYGGKRMVMLIRLCQVESVLKQYANYEYFFEFGIVNIVKEKMGIEKTEDIVFISEDTIAAILPETPDIKYVFKEIVSGIKQAFSIRAGGAVSDVFLAENINDAYIQAKKRLDRLFFCGKYSFVDDEPKVNLFGIEKSFESVYEKKKEQLRKILEKPEASSILQKIETLEMVAGLSEEDIRAIFDFYYYTLVNFTIENRIFDSFDDEFEYYNRELRQYGDLSDYNTWLRKVLVLMAQIMKGRDGTVQRAIEYIQKNYQRDITLNEVADTLQTASSSLSKKFHEQVGVSFIKYITEIRMEKAKELLKSHKYKEG